MPRSLARLPDAHAAAEVEATAENGPQDHDHELPFNHLRSRELQAAWHRRARSFAVVAYPVLPHPRTGVRAPATQ